LQAKRREARGKAVDFGLELRPGPAHVLLAENDGWPIGEARSGIGEQRGDGGGRQRGIGGSPHVGEVVSRFDA
jgi:hypothetical protein